jgi:large subunit ribosomal protein L25
MDLTAQTRAITSKKAKALRKEGFIPAELYGHGIKNAHLSVPVKDFTKVFKEAGENTVVTLLVGGGVKDAAGAAAAEKHPVLIYDVQKNYLTSEVDHVDFYEVKMDEKLKAHVPLEFVGEAPAIREKGAVINKAMSEIEVEAFPQDLPHRLTVDISTLDDFGKTIYVRDLIVPRGVEILVEPETAIVTATEPMKEEVVEVVPVDAAAAVAEVKVETEEKKAERTAEKEQKGEKKEEK